MRRYTNNYYSTIENFINHCTLGDDMLQEILHQVYEIFMRYQFLYQKKILENGALSENEKSFIDKWNTYNIIKCHCESCRITKHYCVGRCMIL